MSSNKSAKEQLIRLYGPECFIDKLHLRPEETKHRYTGKSQIKRAMTLTFHHIQMKKDGRKSNSRKWSIAFSR